MTTKAEEILSEPLSAIKTVAKPAEDKDSAEIHSKSTLFVSRFPFETTAEELESFFSEVGPVKSCFIIKKDSKSTGCGYVQYALAKDAQKAMTELKKKKFDEKRTLKMEFAIKKSVVEERKEAGIPLKEARLAKELSKVQKKIKVVPEGPGQAPKTALQKKLENSVTVLVSDLPDNLPKNVFYKKVRKFGTVEKLIVADMDEEVQAGSAKVVYSSPKEAQKAVKGLNDHIYKGKKIKCKLIETITAASLAKKSRLIIRNLAFHCKKEQLINVFEVFGKITECSIPTKEKKARGFGFVQFENVEDATKAIEGINGQNILNRPVAVDWALGKSQYDRMAADQESDDSDSESENDLELGDDTPNDDASIQDEDAPIIYDQEDSEDDEQNVEKEDEEGCTLFIRNLSFDTTKETLRKTFEHWGPLEYSVITLDKITKLSRGTGFVCFKELAHAKKCLEDYENASQAAQLNSATLDGKKSSILVPSIPESASELTKNFMVDGRFVNVNESISKDIAQKISHASTLSRRAQDKRHLYLMREGVIFPNSDAAALLTSQELEKRTAQYANRKRLLATNPNLFISRTRLSIRGLGPKITDTELRNEAKLAVKKFWAEVADKTRQGIEQEVIDEELEEGLKAPGPERKVWVKQAKVIREADRIDPVTKKPKSKGYGFIEFTSHADALACLRYLNNNPNTFGKDFGTDAAALKAAKRPVVEFAIENRLVLKKRVERNSASKDVSKKRKSDGSENADDKSKKQKKEKSNKEKKVETPKVDSEVVEKDKAAKPKKKSKTFKERREIRKAKAEEKYRKPEEEKPEAPTKAIGKVSKKEKAKQGAIAKVSKKKQEDEKFSNLVANYKKTLSSHSTSESMPALKTSKWYD